MSDGGLVITQKVSFATRRAGRREIKPGPQPVPPQTNEGTIPRISRLMALAIHFDRLIRSGAITDQAELARLGYVTRARVTQIMNLLLLAPDIQESILTLPRTTRGRDPIREQKLRSICTEVDWDRQREVWKALVGRLSFRPMAAL